MRFQKQLSAINTYFAHSASRMHKLHEMEQILTDPIVKPQKLYEIRWLSMYLAVDAIHKCLPSLTTVFSNEAVSGDPTALGLYDTLVSYQFLGLLHFYNDVLFLLWKLSKTFQMDDISFASIQPTVLSVIGAFGRYEISENGKFGEHNIVFSDRDKISLTSFKHKLLSSLISNLKSRFPDLGALAAFKVLDPKMYIPVHVRPTFHYMARKSFQFF